MKLDLKGYVYVLRITEHVSNQQIEDFVIKVLDKKMENKPQGKTWGLLSKEQLKGLQMLLAEKEEVVDALLSSFKAFVLRESLEKKMSFISKINNLLKEKIKEEELELYKISLFPNENGGVDPLNVISCYLEFFQRVEPVDDIEKIKQQQ